MFSSNPSPSADEEEQAFCGETSCCMLIRRQILNAAQCVCGPPPDPLERGVENGQMAATAIYK